MEFVGSEAELARRPVGREWVERLLHERILARKVQEFEWADEIRRRLENHGVVVMDRTVGLDGTDEGVEWSFRRRLSKRRFFKR